MRVELTSAERAQAAGNWRNSLAPLYERRTGPRKVKIDPSVAPYSRWDPVLPGEKAGPPRDQFIWSKPDPGPLPANDEDIAYAPVTRLARWIEKRQLKSERLTNLYLERLDRFNPKLRCVITLMRESGLAQARRADQEISVGKYRGPLHGVPWGAKDLLDTAGIPTTYGAEPFRNRVPSADAAVVKRLNDAGAVLVAKLSLGALALNDIWFGGQTMNPWLPEEGASGSPKRPRERGRGDRGRATGRRRTGTPGRRSGGPRQRLRRMAPHLRRSAIRNPPWYRVEAAQRSRAGSISRSMVFTNADRTRRACPAD